MTAPLPSRIFLAFDDFSRAGKHVLRCANFDGAQSLAMSRNRVETFLPPDLCPFVEMLEYPCNRAACILVKTEALTHAQRWDLADAVVAALSRANVETLTIVAALHLPYAMASDRAVFYRGFNTHVAEDTHVDVPALAPADPTWNVKDAWLAALLHLIQVEQWPRTHVVVAKGYKPGRDRVGTYDAVDALSRALQRVTTAVTIDTQHLQRELAHVVTKEKIATTQNEHVALLYH
ncbi:hypothetical protein PsorP6_017596 [Peronosclerospora sorghi]|uniref:Uncharacterized protein n=1 Tax=Peronosclerospora sorghi TaxID=230839 RepID=A0ACC0WL31_9STRA|nr:hypothetical protein PsorP6_017596 [Peronosclerospora sorghi]